MNCLEEVKQFYASTSKEYLDYIRNCERKENKKRAMKFWQIVYLIDLKE